MVLALEPLFRSPRFLACLAVGTTLLALFLRHLGLHRVAVIVDLTLGLLLVSLANLGGLIEPRIDASAHQLVHHLTDDNIDNLAHCREPFCCLMPLYSRECGDFQAFVANERIKASRLFTE